MGSVTMEGGLCCSSTAPATEAPQERMCSPRMRFAGLLAAASQAAREAGVGGGAADPAAALGLEGMDPEVMNRQAQQIWSMLDDMANNNPTVRRAHAHSSVLARHSRPVGVWIWFRVAGILQVCCQAVRRRRARRPPSHLPQERVLRQNHVHSTRRHHRHPRVCQRVPPCCCTYCFRLRRPITSSAADTWAAYRRYKHRRLLTARACWTRKETPCLDCRLASQQQVWDATTTTRCSVSLAWS